MINGINTEIGENGIKLSGGQKQRIALARAFYHDREFIILDESTSALDNQIENEIINELNLLKYLHNVIIRVFFLRKHLRIKQNYCYKSALIPIHTYIIYYKNFEIKEAIVKYLDTRVNEGSVRVCGEYGNMPLRLGIFEFSPLTSCSIRKNPLHARGYY